MIIVWLQFDFWHYVAIGTQHGEFVIWSSGAHFSSGYSTWKFGSLFGPNAAVNRFLN